MHPGLGLDVAEFVDPVMGELQLPQMPALVSLVDPVGAALEEVAAFTGNDHRRMGGGRRCQDLPVGDDAQFLAAQQRLPEIGRASCRERVCQEVEVSVVAGSLNTKYK